MSSIDQRIVEMQFDNKQFESGIRTSLKSLASLKKGLNLDESAKSLDKLKKAGKDFSLASIATGIDTITRRFSAMGIAGITVMQRLTNAAITTGKRITSALSIDPVRSGLQEYETQINAIQTIMSNTRKEFANDAEALKAVNSALDELNAYADKTIYNFTEMTRNIGTFTAAGVKLETSTAAIKGIANLAAVSGSTSQQASTAMYQLSQALASGTVRLMDWNSLVNAGMGGKVLQDALMETARVHDINIDKMIKNEGSFRETLQKGWLTSEIMLETLQKFTGDLTKEQILAMGYTEKQAEEIIALGKDANDAATKVKTFTQLIETLKEALGSGWAQSWEYIIGNFEEARTLWTNVSDAIGKVIGDNADARNELLKGWRDAGGRDDLIKGLFDAFTGLWGVVKAVGHAMREIFPETTVDDLLAISTAVKEFGENLKSTFHFNDYISGYETIERIVEGVGKAVNLTRELKKGLRGDDVQELQKRLNELGFNAGKEDGIFGKKTRKALKAFEKEYGLTVDGIFDDADNTKLAEALGLTETKTEFDSVAKTATVFGAVLKKVVRIAKGAFAIFDIGGQALQFVFNVFVHALKLMTPFGMAIFEVAAVIGDCFTNLAAFVRESGIFSDWLGSVMKWMEPFGDAMMRAAEAILKFFGIGDAFEDLTDAIDTFPELWKKITDAVKASGAWDKIKMAAEKVKTAFAALKPEIEAFFKTVKEALGEKFQALLAGAAEKIPQWIDAIANFFVKLAEKAEPIIRKIPEYAKALKGFFETAFASVKKFVGKVPDFLSKIGKFFKELFNQIKNSEKFQKAYTKISEVLGKFITAVADFFKNIKATLLTAYENGELTFENIGSFFKKIFEPIGKIGEWFKKIFGKLGDAFKWADDFLEKVGPGGLIGIVIAAIGSLSIFKLVRTVTKFIGGLDGVVDALKGAFKAKKTVQPLSKTFMQLAIAVGVLVGAVYFLGKMDPKVFKKGAITVGVIVAALAGLAVVAGKFLKGDVAQTIESAGKAMFQLAAAVGIIAAAIWVLGGTENERLIRGGITMIAIMGSLAAFAAAISKRGKSIVEYKGLISLAVAIGILAGIASMIGKLDIERMGKGFLGLAAVMLAVGVFIKVLGKNGKSSIQYKGLFSLSIAIGILVGLVALVSKIEFKKFAGGMLGLVAIMGALGLFVRLATVTTKGVKTIKMAGLIAISAAIGMLAAIAFLIGTVPSDTMINGIMGLIGIMAALALFTKVAKKIDVKGGLGMLAILGGMAVAIGVFAYSLTKVKDVDPNLMKTFALSVLGLIGGLGLISGVLGKLGLGAVLQGILALILIIGAIAGVIAGFSALTKIDGFQEFMNGGAASIGSIIGTFVGAFEASKIRAMTDGLKEFGKSDIDQDAIENTLLAVKLISDFEEALPDKTIGEKIANAFLGSDLTNFSNDMVAFGSAAKSLATSMDGVTIDLSTVQLAVDAASLINGLGDAVGTITIGEAIANMIAGGSPFALFCSNMANFGTSITTLQSGVSGLSDSNIEKDTKAAAGAATAVAELVEAISGMNIEKNKSAIEKFFTGDGKVDTVFSKIGTLGTTIADAASKFEGTADSSLVEDTEAVKESVTTLANFLMWLSGDDVYIDYSGESSGYNISNFDNLMDQMAQIGMKISEFSENTKDVDTEKFVNLIDGVKTIASSAAGLAEEGLNDDRVNEVLAGLTKLGTGLVQALSSGFTNNDDSSAIDLVVGGMLGAIDEYDDDFEAAGADMSRGLASGMRKSSYIAAAAAIAVAKAALAAAKKALGIASPSKEFEAFGMYSDEGFAAGLIRYSGVVKQAAEGIGYSALSGLRQTLDNLSTVINNDIDTTPVIRPVMDLSDVASGAQAINGMLSGTSRIGYMGTSSRILAGSIDKTTKEYQNGSGNTNSGGTITNDNSINFAGANFNVRSEQDIHSLANEIAVLSVSQQRALGAAITK